MAYVYISDIGQSSAPSTPPVAAPTAAAAATLETNAKALDLAATAASVASPQAAVSLRAQAEAMRRRAEAIRAELGGLSMGVKIGIGAALLAALGGGYYMTRPRTRANGRRR